MAKWDWKKGMYGVTQKFTLKDPSGAPIDLTGMAVTLYVWLGTVAQFNLAGVVDATPTTGICYFTPTAAEFTVAGKFRFEIEYTQAFVIGKTKDYIVENTEDRV